MSYFDPDCLTPTLKHEGSAVIIWVPIVDLSWSCNGTEYQGFLQGLVEQLFPNATIYTSKIVKNWLKEHNIDVNHLDWSSQSTEEHTEE